MYTKLLVPQDGSDISAAALPYAQSLALLTGAAVVLMRVVESPAQVLAKSTPAVWVTDGGVGMEIAVEAVEAERAEAARELEATKESLQAAGVERVETLVVEGSPGDAIVETVAGLQCDLIVMSTHGRSGLRRAVLGSVADYVVRHADAPVLLCRPQAS